MPFCGIYTIWTSNLIMSIWAKAKRLLCFKYPAEGQGYY